MGYELDHWFHFQHLNWQFSKRNDAGNLKLPSLGSPSSNLLGVPAYMKPYEQNALGITPPVHGYSNSISMASALDSPFSKSYVPRTVTSQKGIPIYDQSGSQTSLFLNSGSLSIPNPINSRPKHSNCSCFHLPLPPLDHGGDVMHEDTEEIDALLYSDSEDEEEASSGHSPVKMDGRNEEATSSRVVPAKTRRFNKENDPFLMDSASSAEARRPQPFNRGFRGMEGTGDSNGMRSKEGQSSMREFPSANEKINNTRLKRKRIHETMGTLRRIVPNGEGKDVVVVLEEVIWYLKSLKQKAKAMGADL